MPGDGRVRIVVDDTACLMPEVARKLDITVVPIGHDINEDAVTTSAVSPLKLCAAYARALERSNKDGSDAGVVALHLGKGMSATWSNAVTAAGALDRVTVIGTDTVGAGVGAAAIAAAKAARAGASRDEVADVARDVLQRYRLWLFVPKLDSLRRGGRISAGQAMLSTALAIKPIVGIKDGSLALVAKCRTEAKVKQRMVDFATKMVRSASSANRPPAVLLHHSDALDDVHELQAMLAEELPDDTRFRILDLPESLAAHVGQGAYAVGMVSGGSIESDAMDFEAEMGVTALLHSVEESDAAAVEAEVPDAVEDDSGNIGNPGDSADMEGADGSVGSAETAHATDSDEPITDQAAVKVVENPAASRNRNKRIHRTVVTNEQGIPLFTTAVSKLPTWSENRQAALDKAERLAKAISDLALRDKSDPEGAVFGTEGEKSQESSSSDKRDDDGDEKKK
ncbi:DegV family protein [Corynebacterium sp. LK24]|uniref:DegV family protein n=1 Tax=Corynebacterium sp. LK24 TaxID=2044583 RepID=UPI001651E451|nr:DegV family protein [Corynebacterium sp. LK24]MBC6758489.1 fatty acid-binding protein DegV [Corynebacterium sp. LK24]